MKTFLLVLGTIFTLGALANWFVPEDPAPTTTTEKFLAPAEVSESIKPNTTVESPFPGPAGTPATTGKVTETRTGGKTTTTRTPVKQIVTDAPAGPRRSEGVTLAMLGAGLGFLLAGGFYDRLQEFSFGGATFKLAEKTAQGAVELKASVDKIEGIVNKLTAASDEDTKELGRVKTRVDILTEITADLVRDVEQLQDRGGTR